MIAVQRRSRVWTPPVLRPVWRGGRRFRPRRRAPDTGTADESSLWWRRARLHRNIVRNYGPRLDAYRDSRDAVGRTFLERSLAVARDDRVAFVHECFERTDAVREDWLVAAELVPPRDWVRLIFGRRWLP